MFFYSDSRDAVEACDATEARDADAREAREAVKLKKQLCRQYVHMADCVFRASDLDNDVRQATRKWAEQEGYKLGNLRQPKLQPNMTWMTTCVCCKHEQCFSEEKHLCFGALSRKATLSSTG